MFKCSFNIILYKITNIYFISSEKRKNIIIVNRLKICFRKILQDDMYIALEMFSLLYSIKYVQTQIRAIFEIRGPTRGGPIRKNVNRCVFVVYNKVAISLRLLTFSQHGFPSQRSNVSTEITRYISTGWPDGKKSFEMASAFVEPIITWVWQAECRFGVLNTAESRLQRIYENVLTI